MLENFQEWMNQNPDPASAVKIAGVLLLSIIAYIVAYRIVARSLVGLAGRTDTTFDDIFIMRVKPRRLSLFAPVLIIFVFAGVVLPLLFLGSICGLLVDGCGYTQPAKHDRFSFSAARAGVSSEKNRCSLGPLLRGGVADEGPTASRVLDPLAAATAAAISAAAAPSPAGLKLFHDIAWAQEAQDCGVSAGGRADIDAVRIGAEPEGGGGGGGCHLCPCSLPRVCCACVARVSRVGCARVAPYRGASLRRARLRRSRPACHLRRGTFRRWRGRPGHSPPGA